MAPKTSRTAQPKRSKIKSKPAPRRKKTTEQILQARRLRLYQQLEKGFYQNAIKTCNQLLDKQGTGNDTLIETKAKLLTVLEQYQETLDYIFTQSVESAGLKLLESYCLYKLGQLEKADKALSNPLITVQEDINRAKLALESQILFKLGRTQEAKAHLEELLVDSDPHHPEHLDLTANLSACQARIDFVEKHIPSQTGKINVDQLEHVPITSSFFHSHPNFPQPSARPRHPRSDKSRKIKPVKPLDPSRPPPDPDRWLPRREKENTNHSKVINRAAVKNKKAKQKLLTQGSVSTALPPSTDPPSSQKSKQTQRKKKNKK
ncbi:hypothetical protein PGT21_021983 [Puccinia graminis f. sp. tritici]|uniref:Signal recognition particle subunit SRP72 n=1 Tax=Puccinia graminis f. sp. tritici TaxID=56615 RepID=A0A5B0N967_PUCGR|nr:hypothetical protein PGT21_021983 [Puccinia graminis f. sp. tritici]KAA1090385.1 hypothetical protein PGTUg99_005971 [Puccinia graminis f. sp. tritici]